MRKAVKTKARVMGKIGAGILITTMAFGVFTGCTSVPKIASGVATSTQLAKTEAAQKAYDFVQRVKDNDYQAIQNEDDRLKYLKIDAVATLVDNTINSAVIHDEAYELIRIDETTDNRGNNSEKFMYTNKNTSDTKEFTVLVNRYNKIEYNTENIGVFAETQVSFPYGTECSIEGIKIDSDLLKRADTSTGLETYEIPYLAAEFRATCSTADWGTLDTVARLVTDENNKEYGKPLAVRFALKNSDEQEVLKATQTMFNEITSYIGTSTLDTDFDKYVTGTDLNLAASINKYLKIMSDDNMVESVEMKSIVASDKTNIPVYVFNDSGEVYVEAKIQNGWIYMKNAVQSENVYCRYRIAKDSTNSNDSGYAFTWFAGTESGYPALIGKVNSGWQDWK